MSATDLVLKKGTRGEKRLCIESYTFKHQAKFGARKTTFSMYLSIHSWEIVAFSSLIEENIFRPFKIYSLFCFKSRLLARNCCIMKHPIE